MTEGALKVLQSSWRLWGRRRSRRALALRLALGPAPVSREWGFDRGTPIDRFYIEGFLRRCSSDVKGRVLEVGDDAYTRRFGGGRVDRSDVLHLEEGNPLATFVADLTNAGHLPSEAFDCIILTQTLQFIYDVRAASGTLHRILRPGGTLLLTVPGVTRINRGEWPGSWHWSFTTDSAARLFGETFGPGNVAVEGHGNVMAACAFLYGLACEDVRRSDLDRRDPEYQVIVAVRAVKGGGAAP
ncbi:hypothetical protein OJF2_49490 [Aquisphaera giovannonii]|uniref:Methyltransferase type 11 domain-containing protein n=1 Tax=Aquisphaera giovannonii TaxID=406548 RepID=A0A5B9W6U0_9BACT|nr:methyltransferase domain-containing protein [Aquisphaera giovannonii]QEH36386.1 hypothetical protein OJF2_49490 [Aquisphaera giovannonii]